MFHCLNLSRYTGEGTVRLALPFVLSALSLFKVLLLGHFDVRTIYWVSTLYLPVCRPCFGRSEETSDMISGCKRLTVVGELGHVLKKQVKTAYSEIECVMYNMVAF